MSESKLNSWKILKKRDVMKQLPDDFQYPEVRLSPTAPRIEKRICCLVSNYCEEDIDREYQKLILSQEWLDWHNSIAETAMNDYDRMESPPIETHHAADASVELNSGTEKPEKKPFFFCMTVCHHRTDAPIGKRCGVVFAYSEEEAEEIAWEKYGSNASCKLWVEEVPEDGYSFCVYKSEI